MSLSFVAILLLVLTGCEPQDRTPGMWLSGELVETAVDNWSFAAEHSEIFVQTNPWYGIAFSVTVAMATAEGDVYVPSIYGEPAAFPGNKYWKGIIDKNPEVVLKIGDKLYPRSARLVTDAAEFERAFEALASKYDFWRGVKNDPENGPPFVLISMDAP